MYKLNRNFYNRDARIVAQELIGKVLVRQYDGKIIKARITETEAYIGAIDKASHGYGGKITKRTKIMYGPPGYTYVYLIYGMYYCLNFVTEGEGVCSAVLVRAVEPVENIGLMCNNRYNKSLNEISKQQLKSISNGPGKLCIALNISKEDNGVDLTKKDIYLLDDEYANFLVEKSKRINIDYAEEAKDFLWRYTIKLL